MSLAPLTLAALEAAIRSAWDVQTSDTPERYDPANPERDQCGATALVVHDYLGGRLLESEVFLGSERTDHHYWNLLPSGLEIDLTRDQFRLGERIAEPIPMDRPTLLGDAAQARYDLLRIRVAATLGD